MTIHEPTADASIARPNRGPDRSTLAHALQGISQAAWDIRQMLPNPGDVEKDDGNSPLGAVAADLFSIAGRIHALLDEGRDQLPPAALEDVPLALSCRGYVSLAAPQEEDDRLWQIEDPLSIVAGLSQTIEWAACDLSRDVPEAEALAVTSRLIRENAELARQAYTEALEFRKERRRRAVQESSSRP